MGLRPDLQVHVRTYCVGCDVGRLIDIEAHAVHVERVLSDKKRKNKDKVNTRLQMAQIQAFESQARGGGRE